MIALVNLIGMTTEYEYVESYIWPRIQWLRYVIITVMNKNQAYAGVEPMTSAIPVQIRYLKTTRKGKQKVFSGITSKPDILLRSILYL